MHPTESPTPISGSFMRQHSRILGEGAWAAAGQLAASAGLLVGTRIITQLVSPDIFGTASLVIGAITLARNVFCTPLLHAAVRFYPEMERRGEVSILRRVVSRYLMRAGGAVSALVLLGGAAYATYDPSVVGTVVLACATLAADISRNFEATLLSGARRQRPLAFLTAAEALSRPVWVVLAVLLLGARTEAILLGYVLSTLLALASLLRFSALEGAGAAKSAEAPAPALWSGLIRYALPLVPLSVIGWITALSDRYIIAAVRGAEDVGLYAASYALMSYPFLVANGITTLTLRPIYYKAVAEGDERGEARVLRLWLGLSLVFCLVGVLAVFLLRGWIARILLAEVYRQGAELMPWIALGYGIFVLQMVLEQKLLAHKRTRAVLLEQALGASACLLVTIPMVLQHGVLGAARACPVYFLLHAVATYALTRWRVRAPRSS